MAANDPATISTRLGAGLAWLAAALYALMVLGLPYPDLGAQRAIFALAAASYAAGGVLLWRGVGHRLLVAGIVANALVMAFWLVRAATGASPFDGFAVTTKVAEIALEIALVLALRANLAADRRVRRPVTS